MAKMHKNHSTKHLLLAAFFLLCFISPCAQGRRLKEVVSHEEKHEVVAVEAKEHSNKLDNLEVPSKETHLPDADELVGMDYSPASKKPPTHN
ncbi:unnamed protein product [Linum tenue]|uniref:Uncharacterized protein n=1 Tax=Linum tenue TaxID=586396 RepID=A0AAV0RBH6_9ROSI|nr:unnamed protein product [Linum tenue]